MKKGFTLIELLVVIAIIGLLAAVVLVSLNGARKNARIAKSLTEVNQIRLALETYYSENGSYPVAPAWSSYRPCYGAGISGEDWIPGMRPKYFATIPRDPRGDNIDCTSQYLYYSDGINYKLISHGPEDCAYVKAKFPNLVDPTRDCWAWGYWTAAWAAGV